MHNPSVRTAKDVAYCSLMTALLIGGQYVLSFVGGVEVVTVLLLAWSFVFGAKRGMLVATAFSLLRNFLYAFSAEVVVLYLVYYNLFALTFGLLGKSRSASWRFLPKLCLLTVVAVLCTACFTLLDDVLTPLWYNYSVRATKAYFISSLPFMATQTVCTAVTVPTLFFPLSAVFGKAFASLHRQREVLPCAEEKERDFSENSQ